jgi:uncharacterized membrane protein (UPF0127 family)
VTLATVERDGQILACDLQVAHGFLARLVGWIGRRNVRAGVGLLLPGVRAVHTVGLRTAIDVAFLAADGRVLAVRRRLRPWRAAVGPAGTAATLELPPGILAAAGVRVGDRVACSRWRPGAHR